MDCCPICQENIACKPSVKILQKGADGINNASLIRGDEIRVSAGDAVHQQCRKDYTNAKELKNIEVRFDELTPSKGLRSTDTFCWKEQCLFCCEYVKLKDKKRSADVFRVSTLDFQDKIVDICHKRNDTWGLEVLSRVSGVNDLPAADALYHQQCSVNFRTGRNMPKTASTPQDKKRFGRPKENLTEEGFLSAMEYLKENDDGQLTVQDLVGKMSETCGEEKSYSTKYMKTRIKEHFVDEVVISYGPGKPNFVTLRRKAISILEEFHKKVNTDVETEKRNIIEAAKELIKSDIKEINCSSKDEYPSSTIISSMNENVEFIPSSLYILLEGLISEKEKSLKIASLGQTIIQAARPRSIICPLQLGLGVQLHHHFGSKFLIDTLNRLGFCLSYSEVQTFELSASVAQDPDVHTLAADQSIQYVADNIDHNVRTLDGLGTFHGMGMLSGITPGIYRNTIVKRKKVSASELLEKAKVDMKYIHDTRALQSPLEYTAVKNFKVPDVSVHASLLCSLLWPKEALGWSGFCHIVADGNFAGKSSFEFLPMIDVNPSSASCIYSTLLYICKEAHKYNADPILTFDQPLYWKALNIVETEPKESQIKSVVLRLGGFHTEMSFLGAIGNLMAGSGLTEVLQTVYAESTVTHMMSGKAISRAIRGHFLLCNALTILMLSDIYPMSIYSLYKTIDRQRNDLQDSQASDQIPVPENAQASDQSNRPVTLDPEVEGLFHDIVSGKICLNDLPDSEKLREIMTKISEFKDSLSDCRTAQLWFMYMDMVEILRMFIFSERTGNWELHKGCISAMLPFLAASGHNLYVKSAAIYLQKMQDLPNSNPSVERFFQEGHHVLRRSQRFWAGLSPDLVIEQVLMRSIKTTGGLTRGRGMTDVQRAQWVLSMPHCARINEAMQEVTSVNFHTSDQHKELGDTRKKRDDSDTHAMIEFLNQRSPFAQVKELRNIETGVSGDERVNADKAFDVGKDILQSMEGKKVSEYVFKKSRQVITLSSKSSVKLDDDELKVDPQLLFQRLLAAAGGHYPDLTEVFKFELSSIPTSMFDTSGVMRLADKSSLADYLWKQLSPSEISDDSTARSVVDGGSLLHKIPWNRGDTFLSICRMYVDFVVRRYPCPTVVFDGYEAGPSTKDHTHRRRTRGITGTRVIFEDSTPFRSKKDIFLSNNQNKQDFIKMLSSELRKEGIDVKQAEADADVLISKTAIELSRSQSTTLFGEDTDLLVLLLFHADENCQLHLRSDKLNNNQKVWNIAEAKRSLGPNLCNLLPVIHALTGCDTTSRLYSIGKGLAIKKILSSESLCNSANVFLQCSVPEEEIIKAGEDIVAALYGGVPHENLNTLRYRKFAYKVAANTTNLLQVQSLPPTSDALGHHSKRAYLQVTDWTSDASLDPEMWGWKLCSGRLEPIKSVKPVAPSTLLTVIRCKCKNDCDTRRCSCRKHGLDCTLACSECRGQSCSNSQSIMEDEPLI